MFSSRFRLQIVFMALTFVFGRIWTASVDFNSMQNNDGKHNYFPPRFRGKNTENVFSATMSAEKTFSAAKSAETLNIFRPVSAEKIRKNLFRADLDGKCFSARFPRKTDGKYFRRLSKPTGSVENHLKYPSSVQRAQKRADNAICFFPCQFAS